MEQKIILSSKAAYDKNNKNTPSNFTTVFDKPIVLDKNKTYVVGLDSINTMTYSWYNISEEYSNKRIQYHNGTEWKNIEFQSGAYSYADIDKYIKESLIANGDNEEGINLEFDLSSFKCLVSIHDRYSLDLRHSNFNTLIGFEKKIIRQTEFGALFPDITNSVDTIYIHCDLISNSLVDGSSSDTIYNFSTADLTRSYPFRREPYRVGFSEINKHVINSIRIYVTDYANRIINLNSVHTSFTLVLKEV